MYPFYCPIWYIYENCPCSYCMLNKMKSSSPRLPPSTETKPKSRFTTEEAIEIAKKLKIDFSKFDIEQFRMGLDVELEHGRRCAHTNITNDDPIMTGKITLAHLNEFPDYYTRLTKMEKEAEEYWEHK